jgi:hypothetical protein
MDPLLFVLAGGLIAAGFAWPRGRREDTGLARARRLLHADEPDACLKALDADQDKPFSDRVAVERRLLRLSALVGLRDWQRAEEILAKPPFLDEEQAAIWADARAQVRLGRGDLEGALAVLEAAEPIPKNARAQLELTKLRILAARGRDDEIVWTGLRKVPIAVLRALARRHAVEPAALIANRILDGGAYR